MFTSSVLHKPQRVVYPTSWVGHIPFAFWITETLRPEIVVELGTHTGNSYFAFCQYVRDHHLPARCYAVDTWKGDEHAGLYDEEVFADVAAYNDRNFSAFSCLLRMTFDEALAHFSDRSIDLLHIDGLHTYEAVRHDFESWLPKMSDRGVILFHDINVRQGDFGVWKLWDELSARYPHLSFDHAHGLGVLAVGSQIEPELLALMEDCTSSEGHALIKAGFAQLGKFLELEYLLKTAEAEREELRLANQHLQEFHSKQQALTDELERMFAVSEQELAARQHQIDALSTQNAAISGELISRQSRIDELAYQRTAFAEELQRLKSSSSWQMTKPIRKITKSARKRSRKIRTLLFGEKKKVTRSSPHAIYSIVSKKSEYQQWIETYDLIDETNRSKIVHEIAGMQRPPLISVVMPVYNPDPGFLQEAIESVRMQLYPHWELCIADDQSPNEAVRDLIRSYSEIDPRIKSVFRESNGHICEASNSAIALATGTFMALLDHDDCLHELALYYAAREILLHPDADLIYTDEDKIDEMGRRHDPYFKSDFNYDLFLNQNMISHLGVYRMTLIRQIGGFRKGFEGSQDYDIALRTIEKSSPAKIRHIPRVLYHWRVHRESTAATIDAKPYAVTAAIKAVDEHLQRKNITARVERSPAVQQMLRVRYLLQDPLPSVEIIVLTRDKVEILKTCIDSIISKTTYPNYRVTIVDNGSVEPETLCYFENLQGDSQISIIRDDSPFNFSRLNNSVVHRSNADFICLLNNDIEVITPEWLDEMMGHAVQSEVGAVGARLWYPNKTLQHGGVIMGLGGVANHAHKNIVPGNPGYFGRAILQQAYSAVTAACLLVSRAKYLEVNGLDEHYLQVAFNDVDFCLKLKERGYRNVWTPYAELYHHESLTRGHEDTPEKKQRFAKEVNYMQHRWQHIIHRDPAYNPNLTLETESFALSWPPRTDHVIDQ